MSAAADLRYLSLSPTDRGYVPDVGDDVVAHLYVALPSGRTRNVYLTVEQLAKLAEEATRALRIAVDRKDRP